MKTSNDVQDLDFRLFEGPNYEQMPKLIAATFVLRSAAQKPSPCRELSYSQRPALKETLAAVLPTTQIYTASVLHENMEWVVEKLSELYRKR